MQLSKSEFKKIIGVDHFYLGFNREEVLDLKALSKLPFCSFQRVKSGKDSWQGVYWTATHGHYFEMIESPSPGFYQLGVAFSANQIQYTDIRLLKKLYGGAKRLTSRFRTLKGKPWYEAFNGGYLKGGAVYMWGMHYFFCQREGLAEMKNEPSAIERFTELEIRANPKFLRDLRQTCFWAPYRLERRGRLLFLDFRHKDRSPFRIKVQLDPSEEFSTFVSLTAQASPYQRPLPKMRLFQLSKKGGNIILRRK